MVNVDAYTWNWHCKKKGTKIKASGSGIVTMAKCLYYTGGTIIIDTVTVYNNLFSSEKF